MIGGLVLAAGAGRRFGAAKQLAELDGRPLLEHALSAMAAAPLGRLVVVLGAGAEEIQARVDLHGAEPVVCADWRDGQAASLRAGIAALADAAAVAITLGDQPRISPHAVTRVLAARDGEASALRATYGGVPGHPVVLERSLFHSIEALSGDAGARSLLAGLEVRAVACDGLGRPDDVDTPDQLVTLRARSRSAAGEDPDLGASRDR